MPSGSEPHDTREVVGIERGAADEGAVDIRHRHEVGDVARLHTAAVEDANRAGGLLVEHVPQRGADDGDGRVGVLGGGVATGADGPDRLVGDDREGRAGGAHAGERSADLAVDPLVGVSRFALLERLPHAHDRRHLVFEDGLELLVHVLVRLTDQLPALGVPDDDVRDVELRQHRRAHLARERALVLPVDVLGTEQDRDAIRLEHRLHGAKRGERRAHHDLAFLVVTVLEPVRELLDDLDRVQMRVVHLPVAGHDRPPLVARHQLLFPSRSARSPGRSRCSMNSRDAPPPVLTWSMRSASPKRRTAAALSPPPTTVNPRHAATAFATARVPAANGATSNTPMGPFHSSIAAPPMSSAKAPAVSGPMSRPLRPAGIAYAATTRASASSLISSATTTSVGIRTRPLSRRRRHSSTISGSTSESPTEWPW